MGAAIAIGSHGENGKIALLVIKVATKIKIVIVSLRYLDLNIKSFEL